MNGKEAIEVLKMNRPFGGDIETERLREAIDFVIPLVELRIPKEPVDCGGYKKCPNCGNIEISNYAYCPDCGQNLLGQRKVYAMRKCIVTIPAIERYMERNAAGELQREVLKEAETHNAFFHRWVVEQCELPVYKNGFRQYSPVFALVEYEDGTVHRVEPEYIKFVER